MVVKLGQEQGGRHAEMYIPRAEAEQRQRGTPFIGAHTPEHDLCSLSY